MDKAVADRKTKLILGAQIVGGEGVKEELILFPWHY